MIRILSIALVFSIFFGSASACLAQAAAPPPGESDAEARALFTAGREAFAAAQFERAVDYFQRALI